MVKRRRSWRRPLAVVVLLAGAVVSLLAQSPHRMVIIHTPAMGSLSGRLTDLHSSPLAGVALVLRNQASGAEFRATTGRNGAYRFPSLPPGEYTLQAQTPKLGRGSLERIEIDAGVETHMQMAMRFRQFPPKAGAALAVAASAPQAMHAVPPPVPGQLAPAPTLGSSRALLALESAASAPLPPDSLPALAVAAKLPSKPLEEMHLPSRLPSEWLPRLTILRSTPSANIPAQPLHRFKLAATATPPSGRLSAIASRAALAHPSLVTTAEAVAGMPSAIQPNHPLAPPIEVAANRENPATAAVTTTISGAELQSLPLSSRDWQQFVLNTPMASTQDDSDSQASLRGTAGQPIGTAIDGMTTNLAFGNTYSNRTAVTGDSGDSPNRMAQAWAGGRAMVGEAAIRQVRTVAGNAEAQASRAAGGQVSVSTEGGSNHIHGQAYLFDRQNSWNAQNPFTQWVRETSPPTNNTTPVFTPQSYTPPDHETSWGIGAGGHIVRNRLFWFSALDASHRNNPSLSMVREPGQFFAQPSDDQMQVLSARLGLSSVNPVAEGLGAYSRMLETLAGLLGPAPRTSSQWIGFGRIDWRASDRHTFTLEGIGADWNAPGGGLRGTAETYGNHSFGSTKAKQQWLLARWQAFITPNLLAVTQASVGRAEMKASPETPSPFEETLVQGFWGQLPQIVVDSRYGFTIGNPTRFGSGTYPTERIFHLQQMVDWVHNSLLFRAGFEVGHNADSTSLLRNQTGRYYYSSVENFASDALVYGAFGLQGMLNPASPHGCDETGRVWRNSGGNLRGLGNLPCYSYYSQTMGPTYWHLSTNDWASYATAQWQPSKRMVFSAGLRWDREQMPPPIAWLANPDLPLAEKLPDLGNSWGPRISLAMGSPESRWPVLRLGYGMYYGRTQNATIESVLTHSGSLKGDMNFFIRPTDGFNPFTATSGAPLFPYVLQGEPLTIVKPDALEFAPNFRNPEIHQAVASVAERLPAHLHLSASAVLSLGRRLPISTDTNFDPSTNPKAITYNIVDGTGKGPLKAPQITVPFYATWPSPIGATGRLNPNYQQISEIESRANSTYEAAVLRLSHYGRSGLSFYVHYTYAHAMDWNPDQSIYVGGSSVLDPANFTQEYGISSLDVRHSGGATLTYSAPWRLDSWPGRLVNGWRLSSIGYFRSGLPFTMRISGSLPKEFDASHNAIIGLGPGMNGSGGDNRVYSVGRNTYRYPWTWKADFRMGKRFNLGHMRQLELMAESFNLFNHQNVTRIETTGYYISSGSLTGGLPSLHFLNGLKINRTTGLPEPTFGQPLTIDANSFFRQRQIELGLRMKF